MKLFYAFAAIGVVGLSLFNATPINAGTLGQCGHSRQDETTRCYEESNGCFSYQAETLSKGCHKERYWTEGKGVRFARSWCYKNGGSWLAPDSSQRLGERCSL